MCGFGNKVFWNQFVTHFSKTIVSCKGDFLAPEVYDIFKKYFNLCWLCEADLLKHVCFLPMEIWIGTQDNLRSESLSSSEIVEMQDEAKSETLIDFNREKTSTLFMFAA